MKQIEIDVGANLKTLEADLKKAEREIARFQKQCDELSQKHDISIINEEQIRKQLADAKARLEELKNMTSEQQRQMLLSDGPSRDEQIKATEAEIATLNKQLDKSVANTNSIDEKWQSAEANLSTATADAERASASIAKIESNMGGTSKAAEALDGAFKSVEGYVKRIAKRLLIYGLISMAVRKLRSYFGDFIKQNEQASDAVGRLKGAFATLAQPLMQAVIPALVTIINWITRAITAITQVISMLSGKSFKDYQKEAKKGGKGGAGGKNNSMAAFDTVNVLSSGGGGGASGIEAIYNISELTKGELVEILAQVIAIGSAIAAWRLKDAVGPFQNIALLLMTIASAVVFVKKYFDAWINGIDTDNAVAMIASLVGVLVGLRLLLGPTAQAIASIVAGLALFALGFKDAAANGVNLHNVLIMIAGVIATGLGIAFFAGSLIPLLVAAIGSIVIALTALGGEGDTVISSLKDAFTNFVEFVKALIDGDLEGAWTHLKESGRNALNALLGIVGGCVNAIIKGLNWLINKINSIQFAVPDWVPAIGGKSLSPHIPNVNEWSIPYLAQGAVIPPNHQFMAMLGDQKSGTNIETPLSTMVEAFRQAQAGQSININFTGDLAALARILKPQIDNETTRRGGSLLVR